MADKEYQKQGYVYVLSNPSMPGVVKIGRSKSGGKHRAQQMYTTGVPEPFHLEFEVLVKDAEEAEAYAHEQLKDCRVNGSREFFKCEVLEAVWVVGEIWANDVHRTLVPFEVVWDDGDLDWLCKCLSEEKGIDVHPFAIHQAITMEMTTDVAAMLWEKYQDRMRKRKESSESHVLPWEAQSIQ